MDLFTPISDIVVIKRYEPDKTDGGIIIPMTARGGLERGTVVAVGPGRIIPKTGERVTPQVKEGDTVVFGPNGMPQTIMGEDYVVSRDRDLYAVLEGR